MRHSNRRKGLMWLCLKVMEILLLVERLSNSREYFRGGVKGLYFFDAFRVVWLCSDLLLLVLSTLILNATVGITIAKSCCALVACSNTSCHLYIQPDYLLVLTDRIGTVHLRIRPRISF